MSKKAVTIIIVIIFVLAVFVGLRLLSGEDDWLCQDGQWVKHGQPSAPAPTFPCD